MAGLVRFSDAISSSVSDCRLYSWRMRLAMSGSALSRARKDMVTRGAATSRIVPLDELAAFVHSHTVFRRNLPRLYTKGGWVAWSAGLRRWRAEQLLGRDRAQAQDVRLRAGEVEHGGGGPARGRAAIQDRRQSGQLPASPAVIAGSLPCRFALVVISGPE